MTRLSIRLRRPQHRALSDGLISVACKLWSRSSRPLHRRPIRDQQPLPTLPHLNRKPWNSERSGVNAGWSCVWPPGLVAVEYGRDGSLPTVAA
jgi:hypothetical protein